jgi:hypothetical protein
MSLSKFLFYIIETDGRSNYVVNGVVSSRGTPTPLNVSPDGWQEIAFAWERNLQKHGIARNFSKDLTFYEDGAQILRDAFYRKNVDRQLFILIQELHLEITDTKFKWVYKYLYKGELDFSTGQDDTVTGAFKISIMEGGLTKLLNANQTTTYFIPFDDDSVILKHDGIEIENRIAGIVEEVYGEDSSFYFKNHIPRLNITSSETNFFGGSKTTQRVQINNSNTAIRGTGQYFLKATTAGTVEFVYNIPFTMQYTPSSPAPNPAAEYRIVVRQIAENNISSRQTELFLRESSLGFNGNFRAEGTGTIDVEIGDELYIYAFCNVQGSTGDDQIRIIYTPDENAVFRAKFKYRHTTSFVKCFTRSTAFRKLCKQLFGHEEYAVSELLAKDNRLLTSGPGLRSLDGAGIKLTFQDFFTDLDTDLMAGVGVEAGGQTANLTAGNRLVIEERTHFYDESNPIDLGIPDEVEVSFAKEWVASAIKSGWKDPVIDEVNGRYAFNGQHQYTTPLKRISKEFSLVSPFKSDPVDIEFVRVNMDGKTTTDDTSSDNDTFVMVAEPGETQYFDEFQFQEGGGMVKPSGFDLAPGQVITVNQSSLNDGTYTVLSVTGNQVLLAGATVNETVACLVEIISGGPVWRLIRYDWDNADDPEDFGVPSPSTYYNFDLTPHRKLMRHFRWIRSFLHNYDTERVEFKSGTNNTDLKTTLDGVTIRENQSELVGAMGQKIFIPYIITFKKNSLSGIIELMEANPNRCFQFTKGSKTFKIFALSFGFAANTLEEQEYKGISVPGNDLIYLTS